MKLIEDYQFGFLKINGESYNEDLEIHWDGKVLSWIREESHFIKTEDVKRAFQREPEIIVIGTGKSGMAKVGKEIEKAAVRKGIELVKEKTDKAVEIFNQLRKEKRVIGFFHLTC